MAHTSKATIVNFQRNAGSVTLQVLSIIRRITNTIYTPRRLQSLEPGQKIAFENLRTQEWKPVVVQGKIQGIPRSCIVSIPSDRELRHNQSQIRGSPIKVQATEIDGLGFTQRADRQAAELRANQSVIPGTGSPASQPIISEQGSRCHLICDPLRTNCQSITGSTSKAVLRFLQNVIPLSLFNLFVIKGQVFLCCSCFFGKWGM